MIRIKYFKYCMITHKNDDGKKWMTVSSIFFTIEIDYDLLMHPGAWVR